MSDGRAHKGPAGVAGVPKLRKSGLPSTPAVQALPIPEGLTSWRARFGAGFAIGERSQHARDEEVAAGRRGLPWVAFDGFGNRGEGLTAGAAVDDLRANRLARDLERGLLESGPRRMGLVELLQVAGFVSLLVLFALGFLLLMVPALFIR